MISVKQRLHRGWTTKQMLDVKRFVFSPLFCTAARPLTVLALIKGYGIDLSTALCLADVVEIPDEAAHYELTGY